MSETKPWKSWEETDTAANGTVYGTVLGTCSYKPRPQVQTGRHLKYGGRQRDVWHVQKSGVTTLCGVDCSEWLRLGEIEIDDDLCKKCKRRLK